jgi:leucoanthocyanidin reductase
MLQRFLPSEFGHDVVRADPVEPGMQMYNDKRVIRRLIEEYRIPYNYICCNSIASWPYYDNKHPADVLPPLDHFKIYGDGTVRGTPLLSATPFFFFFFFLLSRLNRVFLI